MAGYQHHTCTHMNIHISFHKIACIVLVHMCVCACAWSNMVIHDRIIARFVSLLHPALNVNAHNQHDARVDWLTETKKRHESRFYKPTDLLIRLIRKYAEYRRQEDDMIQEHSILLFVINYGRIQNINSTFY